MSVAVQASQRGLLLFADDASTSPSFTKAERRLGVDREPVTRASGHGVPGGAEDEFAEPGLAAMGGGTDCGSIQQPRLWRSNELVTSPSDAANTSVAIEIVGDGVGTDTLLASARPSPSRATSHGGIVRRAGARSWSRRLQPSGRGRRRARLAGCSDGVRRAASRRSAPRNRNPVSARCNFWSSIRRSAHSNRAAAAWLSSLSAVCDGAASGPRRLPARPHALRTPAQANDFRTPGTARFRPSG